MLLLALRYFVSAAIVFIVLFVATLRFWPVLETRDDLTNDNGQNRPLARGMGGGTLADLS